MITARYIAHSGDDLMVVNAARVSFHKESEWDLHVDAVETPTGSVMTGFNKLNPGDVKLIRYLADHDHWTPFAHPQITLQMSAPLFVRTQCFKHKVGFVENEVSRRYVDEEPLLYHPEVWRGRAKDKKQGSEGEIAEKFSATYWANNAYQAALRSYGELLEMGVAPEQARMVLPQAMITEWYWTGSLAAYARFYRDRTKPDAQAETGMAAKACGDIIAPLFPVSWGALVS